MEHGDKKCKDLDCPWNRNGECKTPFDECPIITKTISDLEWIYSELSKGTIIEHDDMVIQSIRKAIELLKKDGAKNNLPERFKVWKILGRFLKRKNIA